MLAGFVRVKPSARCADLGSGTGLLSVLLCQRHPELSVTGIEIGERAAELSRENLRINGFEGRAKVLCADLRDHRSLFEAGSFDAVFSNPPYFPAGGGGSAPEGPRRTARSETDCSLSDVCQAAAALLRFGGAFFMVHRPERLSEICVALTGSGLEPKRLRLVCPRAEAAPALALIESRRGGKPGLRIEPSLVLTLPDGSPSPEVRELYHL